MDPKDLDGSVTPSPAPTSGDKWGQPDDSTAKNLSAMRKMYQSEIKERDSIITELNQKISSVSEKTAQTIKAKEDEFNAKLSEITQEKQSLLSYKEKFEALDVQFDTEATKELEELKTSLGEEKFGEFSKVVTLEWLSGFEKIQKIKASKGLFGATKPPANPQVPGGTWSSDAHKRYLELARKQRLEPNESAEFQRLAKELQKL